jgi:predicted aldo/keto reductase-like oxidoreductase
MEQRILGKTGFEVSALGFGGGPVGFLSTDRQQVAEILNPLLDQGVNLIGYGCRLFWLGRSNRRGCRSSQGRLCAGLKMRSGI